jgi:hypothetical protein
VNTQEKNITQREKSFGRPNELRRLGASGVMVGFAAKTCGSPTVCLTNGVLAYVSREGFPPVLKDIDSQGVKDQIPIDRTESRKQGGCCERRRSFETVSLADRSATA